MAHILDLQAIDDDYGSQPEPASVISSVSAAPCLSCLSIYMCG
jgi:hypothetical protein